MLVINQDHYVVGVAHGGCEFKITQEDTGSRYAVTIFRTFVDSNSPEDIERANKLQDMIEAHQADRGRLEVPDWDLTSLSAVRNALNVLVPMMGDYLNGVLPAHAHPAW